VEKTPKLVEHSSTVATLQYSFSGVRKAHSKVRSTSQGIESKSLVFSNGVGLQIAASLSRPSLLWNTNKIGRIRSHQSGLPRKFKASQGDTERLGAGERGGERKGRNS
jgi:hypothetical protein